MEQVHRKALKRKHGCFRHAHTFWFILWLRLARNWFEADRPTDRPTYHQPSSTNWKRNRHPSMCVCVWECVHHLDCPRLCVRARACEPHPTLKTNFSFSSEILDGWRWHPLWVWLRSFEMANGALRIPYFLMPRKFIDWPLLFIWSGNGEEPSHGQSLCNVHTCHRRFLCNFFSRVNDNNSNVCFRFYFVQAKCRAQLWQWHCVIVCLGVRNWIWWWATSCLSCGVILFQKCLKYWILVVCGDWFTL